MKKESLLKILAYWHIIYLCLLPFAAAFAVLAYDYNSYTMRFAGWIPGIVFFVIILAHYQLTTHSLKAILVVFIVPLELLIRLFYFHSPLSAYILEVGFIELFSLIAGLFITMAIYKPSGGFGVFIGFSLTLIVFIGLGLPLYDIYRAQDSWLLWLVVFSSALLSGVWAHMRIFIPFASSSSKSSFKMPSFFYSDEEDYLDSPFQHKDPSFLIIFYILLWIIFFFTPFSSLFY